MPSEAVSCPNCGSSACTEYRDNSFVCQHCDRVFRWTNPNERTVTLKASHCKCGTNAMGRCIQCGEGVCEKHHHRWMSICKDWGKFRMEWIRAAPDQRLPQAMRRLLAECRKRGIVEDETDLVSFFQSIQGEQNLSPSIVQTVAARLGLKEFDSDAIICETCKGSIEGKLFDPIEEEIERLIGNSKICSLCGSDKNVTVCCVCSDPRCETHAQQCVQCKSIWCELHKPSTFSYNDGVKNCGACRGRGELTPKGRSGCVAFSGLVLCVGVVLLMFFVHGCR